MNSARPTDTDCVMEQAFNEIVRWKKDRNVGKIILHFNGNGNVKAVEVSQIIAKS